MRKGTAAKVAETAAVALAKHEAARRVNFERAAAEVLEARARDNKALVEALARARELELSAAAALELPVAAAGGRRAAWLEGKGLPRGDLEGKDLAGEDVPEGGGVFERDGGVRIVPWTFPRCHPRLASRCELAVVKDFNMVTREYTIKPIALFARPYKVPGSTKPLLLELKRDKTAKGLGG